MSSVLRRFATTLACLMALGVSAALAQGQNPNANFRLPSTLPGQQQQQAPAMAIGGMGMGMVGGATSPYLTPIQSAPNMGMGNLSTPYLNSFAQTPAALYNPGYMAGPYNNPYYNPYLPYYNPLGGALMGVADVTNANAQYQVTIQQARMVQQQANQAAIETRRRMFDQIRYERMSMPTPEDIRIRDMQIALNRSRRNPPRGDIWSGDALNSLMDHLVKQQGAGLRGPRVDLDEDTLKKINVMGQGAKGNIGLLKDGGQLQWPVALDRPEFADAKKTLNQLLPDAVQQVKFNNPLPGNVRKDIQAAVTSLNDALAKSLNDMTPNQYIEARRYLNFLNEGVNALQDTNASSNLNQKWVAKVKTVAELVEVMSKGLHFLPATPGDEAAYVALQQALVAYDDGMQQVAQK